MHVSCELIDLTTTLKDYVPGQNPAIESMASSVYGTDQKT